MTTQPDIDAIARDAAKNCAPGSNTELVVPIIAEALRLSQGRLAPIIAAAIRRYQGETYPNLFQELSRQITELKSERDAAVNGMLDLKRTNQMLAEQLQKHAEAIEVLKTIEWVNGECPFCRWFPEAEHRHDCKLAKAIGK